MANETKHKSLPVQGYTTQSNSNVELVNRNKKVEELVLKIIDELGGSTYVDKHWLAVAKTDIEKGFMSLNRSIFQPKRALLVSGDKLKVNSLDIKVETQGDEDAS